MKYLKINYPIASAFVVMILATFAACNKNSPTASEETLSKLTGTWHVSTVTVDGVDATDLFQNMTVTFSKTDVTASNGGVVWPALETWTFFEGNEKVIQRADNVNMTIETLSNTKLTLSLLWSKTTYGPGRSNSISGKHVFEFSK